MADREYTDEQLIAFRKRAFDLAEPVETKAKDIFSLKYSDYRGAMALAWLLNVRTYDGELSRQDLLPFQAVNTSGTNEYIKRPVDVALDLWTFDPLETPIPPPDTHFYFDGVDLWWLKFLADRRILKFRLTRGLHYALKRDAAGYLYYPGFKVFQPDFVSDFDIQSFDPEIDPAPTWYETGYIVSDYDWLAGIPKKKVKRLCFHNGIICLIPMERGLQYAVKESDRRAEPILVNDTVAEQWRRYDERMAFKKSFKLHHFNPNRDPMPDPKYGYFMKDGELWYDPISGPGVSSYLGPQQLWKGIDYNCSQERADFLDSLQKE